MGGLFSRIFGKKPLNDQEQIERYIAKNIVTVAMALGSSFIKHYEEVK